ncbi:MAG: alginate export family protein [Desulfobacteraceae bacterium]|nr:alginate export family protein [Desulfobacteraceae bacterium]
MKKLVILFLVVFLSAPAFGAAGNWSDKLELGGSVQMRWYYLNNFLDFNDSNKADDWNTFRLHTKVNAKATISDDISGFIQLANQTWGNGVAPGNDLEGVGDKIFVDNAYLTVNHFFGSDLIFQAGRMNLMYGSGFVLFDGNSQFGSTNMYFDGAKLTLPIGQKSTLDALYFIDEENNRADNPKDDITMGGLYLTAHCPVMGSEKGQQEIYALNRRDDKLTKDIWMTGIRLSDQFETGFDYSGEVAYQMGKFQRRPEHIDQKALGCKLDAGYTLVDAPTTPRIFCGYTFMEGNDPKTHANERWDVFYGGWPQWGDMLAWKYLNLPGNSIADYDPNYNSGSSTTGEAVYSNLSIASAGIGAKLTTQLSMKFTYGLLTVDEPDYYKTLKDGDPGYDAANPANNRLLVKNSDDFGNYYQLDTNYAYTKNLSFWLYTAMIDPGKAFKNSDPAYEVLLQTKLVF